MSQPFRLTVRDTKDHVSPNLPRALIATKQRAPENGPNSNLEKQHSGLYKAGVTTQVENKQAIF